MKGAYMTKDQRAKVAQNTGKTHFKLGNDGPDYYTTSGACFKWSDKKEGPGADLGPAMVRSHISLGPDASSIKTKSEFIDRYRKHPLGSTASASKLDLRKHNFDLGTEQNSMQTTSNAYYAGVTTSPVIKNSGAHLRKHNFVLGNDPATKSSTFGATYTKKDVKPDDITHTRKELRTSHFKLGNDPVNYLSNQHQHFDKKESHPSLLDLELQKDLKSEHFKLGTDKPLHQSTSQASFNKKDNSKESINKDRLKELRASHFKLGSSGPMYSLASHEAFKVPSLVSIENSHSNAKFLKQSNFKLGCNQSTWLSSYTDQHKGKPSSGTKKYRDRLSDWNSKIKLGSDPDAFMTTASGSFKAHEGVENGLDPRIAQNIKNSHFDLGKYRSDYNTTYNQLGKGNGQRASLDSKLLNDLRATHFKYGNDPAAYVTNFRKDFTKKTSQPGSFQADLRKHNIKVGSDNGEWNTEQRDSFKWVQPIPESEFQFSLD